MKYVKVLVEWFAFGAGFAAAFWFLSEHSHSPLTNDRPFTAPATSIYPQGRPTE